jgi:hypothetical protein
MAVSLRFSCPFICKLKLENNGNGEVWHPQQSNYFWVFANLKDCVDAGQLWLGCGAGNGRMYDENSTHVVTIFWNFWVNLGHLPQKSVWKWMLPIFHFGFMDGLSTVIFMLKISNVYILAQVVLNHPIVNFLNSLDGFHNGYPLTENKTIKTREAIICTSKILTSNCNERSD